MDRLVPFESFGLGTNNLPGILLADEIPGQGEPAKSLAQLAHLPVLFHQVEHIALLVVDETLFKEDITKIHFRAGG